MGDPLLTGEAAALGEVLPLGETLLLEDAVSPALGDAPFGDAAVLGEDVPLEDGMRPGNAPPLGDTALGEDLGDERLVGGASSSTHFSPPFTDGLDSFSAASETASSLSLLLEETVLVRPSPAALKECEDLGASLLLRAGDDDDDDDVFP